MNKSAYTFTQSYSVISYGNGIAFEVMDVNRQVSVHIQGDDATTFQAEIDACQTDAAVDRFLSGYDDVMA